MKFAQAILLLGKWDLVPSPTHVTTLYPNKPGRIVQTILSIVPGTNNVNKSCIYNVNKS
jgi:hypothetical protein